MQTLFPSFFPLNEEVLRKLYVEDGYSVRRIARLTHHHDSTIHKALRKFNIPVRSRRDYIYCAHCERYVPLVKTFRARNGSLRCGFCSFPVRLNPRDSKMRKRRSGEKWVKQHTSA